jgi:trimeric autotransporter adhesin
MVKDIWPRDHSGLSYPSFTAVGAELFFVADDGVHGGELWKSSGSRSGTVLVKDISPCSNQLGATYLGRAKGTLFFAGNDSTNGLELWKSDGTRSGTVMVKDINTISYSYQ